VRSGNALKGTTLGCYRSYRTLADSSDGNWLIASVLPDVCRFPADGGGGAIAQLLFLRQSFSAGTGALCSLPITFVLDGQVRHFRYLFANNTNPERLMNGTARGRN
jgi:hypothetical protein